VEEVSAAEAVAVSVASEAVLAAVVVLVVEGLEAAGNKCPICFSLSSRRKLEPQMNADETDQNEHYGSRYFFQSLLLSVVICGHLANTLADNLLVFVNTRTYG
jgi:hypothetical protein